MDSERFARVMQIFQEACGKPAAGRAEFLQSACGDDADLREQVESMLAHDQRPAGVMGGTAVGGGMRLLAAEIARSDAESARSARGAQAPVEAIPPRIGRYRIIRKIGEGGMGAVFEAEQEHPRRTVAVKVMRAGFGSRELVRRFEYEVHVLGRLQHPGIAQIYEAGTAEGGGGQAFFAMELVRGPRLTDFAEGKQFSGAPDRPPETAERLGTRERLDLLARVCDAVQHAHQKGVIHRDLKPSNILVDENGQPKILDFGVARTVDSEAQITMATSTGQIIGTLPYMSPEQVAGNSDEIDTRSDVYALGVVLYELLTGKVPHEVASKSIIEAARVIREEAPARLSSISRIFRGEVETIVAKALEKDKTRRYQSAADLAADLRRYLRGEPIDARRDSGWYVLRKTLRYYRVAVGVAMGFVVLVLAFAGWLSILYRDQVKLRAHAQEQAQIAGNERDRAVAAEKLAGERLAETTIARDSEKEARVKAETEVQKAQQTLAFLTNMLLSVSPTLATKHDITVREILDKASKTVATQLAKQPEVRASIEQVIGLTYTTLGVFEPAENHLRVAYALRRELLGPKNLETIATLQDLGRNLEDKGKYAEAAGMYAELLAGRLKPFNAGWVDIDQIMSQPDTPERLTQLYQAVDVAVTLNDLGDLAVRRGDYDDAQWYLNETLRILRAVRPVPRQMLAFATNSLGQTYYARGDLAAAEPLLREAMERHRAIYGPRHAHVAVGMTNIGTTLLAQERFKEAAPLLYEALQIDSEIVGRDSLRCANVLHAIARMHYSLGDYAECECVLDEVIATRRKLHPDGHVTLADALVLLAATIMKLDRDGRFSEAELALREAIQMRWAAHGPIAHPETALAGLNLGTCLTAQRRFEEAEVLLLDSAGVLGVLGTDVRRNDSIQRIVELYEQWGKPDKAAEYRQALDQPSPGIARSGG